MDGWMHRYTVRILKQKEKNWSKSAHKATYILNKTFDSREHFYTRKHTSLIDHFNFHSVLNLFKDV